MLTGRLTKARAAGAGAISGAWVGLMIGILLGLFTTGAWLGVVVAGVAIGCGETAQSAAVAHLAPERYRGSAFGLQSALQSIGNLTASAIAGLLWTIASPTAAFLYASAWMLIAFTGLLSTRTRGTPDEHHQ